MEYKTSKQKQQEYGRVKILIANMFYGYTNEYGEKIPAVKEIQEYLKWSGMTEQERKSCTEVWDKYYSGVRNTRAYFNYKEMCQTSKVRNMARVMELSEEAVQLREKITSGNLELEKPKVLDPNNFLQKMVVNQYKVLLWRKRTMEEESKEIEKGNSLSNVFGSIEQEAEEVFG